MATAAPLLLVLALALGLVSGGALAEASGSGGYSCANASGRQMRSDRILTGCVGEQWELYGNGSRKRLVPPLLSPEEEANAEEKRRHDEVEAAERRNRQRNEERMLQLYPNPAALEAARQSELAATRSLLAVAGTRFKELMVTRKPLLDEAEFYVNKPLPPVLKRQLDANDATLAAQKLLVQNLQDELKRINDRKDGELQQMNVLWRRSRGTAP